MKHLIRWVSLVLLSLSGLISLFAADAELRLPADFVRVTRLDDLTEDGWYALGALSSNGELIFMKSEVLRNDKLKGISSHAVPRDKFNFTNARVVWKIQKVGTHSYRLLSAEDGNVLSRVHSGKLGLRLDGDGTGSSDWSLVPAGKGTFLLTEPADEERGLGLSTMIDGSGEYYYFDNYKWADTREIYLYKLPQKISDLEGEVVMPAQGQHVALWNDQKVRSLTGEAIEAENEKLCNGTLAPSTRYESWTCQVVDASRFALQGQHGYLNYKLQEESQPTYWQILRGFICTAESVPRYLCYDDIVRRWMVESEEQAKNPAHFIKVSDAPKRQLGDDGVCVLSGGWSASELAALSWDDVRCLDLTRIAVPIRAKAFASVSERVNVPVFVDETMREYVPEIWNFVVICGKENRLLRQTVLTDRTEFYTDRPFEVDRKQMIYERNNSRAEVWETVCLPFDASVVSGNLFRMVGIDQGNPIFEPMERLEAGRTCLLFPKSSSKVLFESMPCTVRPYDSNDPYFRGTYTGFQVASSSQNLYHLSADGNAFVHAASGSYMPPFRGALRWAASKAVSVAWKK